MGINITKATTISNMYRLLIILKVFRYYLLFLITASGENFKKAPILQLQYSLYFKKVKTLNAALKYRVIGVKPNPNLWISIKLKPSVYQLTVSCWYLTSVMSTDGVMLVFDLCNVAFLAADIFKFESFFTTNYNDNLFFDNRVFFESIK